jgi:hypothetical protein
MNKREDGIFLVIHKSLVDGIHKSIHAGGPWVQATNPPCWSLMRSQTLMSLASAASPTAHAMLNPMDSTDRKVFAVAAG